MRVRASNCRRISNGKERMIEMEVEKRLKELRMKLPPARPSVGKYVRTARVGNVLYISGTGSVDEQNTFKGKLGRELTTQEGYQAARLCALKILATLKSELGDLDQVVRIVRLVGIVNCTQEFEDHSIVLDGASELFVQVFGDRGNHTRSVIGAVGLPSNIAVEVEAMVEIDE